MANTFVSPFVQAYKTQSAVVTAALGGLGTSTVTGAVAVASAAAGSGGAVVTRLTAIPRATIGGASLVLFLVKASAPAVYNLLDSEVMASATVSTTAAIPETTFGNITNDSPLRLEAGDTLYVGSQVALAAGIVFTCQWGNL